MGDESIVLWDGGWIAVESTCTWEVEIESNHVSLQSTKGNVMNFEVVEASDWNRALRDLNNHLELKGIFWDISEGDLGFVDLAFQKFMYFFYGSNRRIGLIEGELLLRIIELLGDNEIEVERVSGLLLHFLDENKEVLRAWDLEVLFDRFTLEVSLGERKIGEGEGIDDTVVSIASVDEVLIEDLISITGDDILHDAEPEVIDLAGRI
jgi:hypothetical protein